LLNSNRQSSQQHKFYISQGNVETLLGEVEHTYTVLWRILQK